MIQVYTDGASRGNKIGASLISAAGYWITDKSSSVHVFGEPVTNNYAEMFAVDMFLNDIKKFNFTEFTINTDSQLVIGVFSHGWKATKNLDLVNSIKLKLVHLYNNGYKIVFNKVKGHSNNYGNNMIDKLLNEEMDKVIK